MKKGWQTKQIGYLCEVIAGQSPEGKFYNSEGKGMAFYQGKKDFGEKFIKAPTTWTTQTTKIAKEGDILMSVRAPVGPVNFAADEICIGRGLAAIRSGNELNRDFLFYQLLYLRPKIAGKKGAVFASINKSEIEAIPLAFPPLPEQQHIVKILDQGFAAIDKAKANAEKNLKNSRELFESYLRNAFENLTNGPKTTTLNDCCELIVDCEHKTAPVCKEKYTGYYSIRTPNIGKGKLLYEDANQVTEEVYKQWTQRAIPQEGDLILAREAPAGNVGIIPHGVNFCLGQRTVLIRPLKDKIYAQFLVWLILSPKIQEALLYHSRGATVTHVNMKDIRVLSLSSIPHINEQKKIVINLDKLSSESKKLEDIHLKKIALLEELKQSILQKAFDGQL